MPEALDINELRAKIDGLNEKIMGLLSERSKLPLNESSLAELESLGAPERLLNLYKETLRGLCKGEEGNAEESLKLDKEILGLLIERTNTLGATVGEYKINQEPSIKEIKNAEEIRGKIKVPEREKEVVRNIVSLAEKFGINDSGLIETFAQGLIEVTLDSEVKEVLERSQTLE